MVFIIDLCIPPHQSIDFCSLSLRCTFTHNNNIIWHTSASFVIQYYVLEYCVDWRSRDVAVQHLYSIFSPPHFLCFFLLFFLSLHVLLGIRLKTVVFAYFCCFCLFFFFLFFRRVSFLRAVSAIVFFFFSYIYIFLLLFERRCRRRLCALVRTLKQASCFLVLSLFRFLLFTSSLSQLRALTSLSLFRVLLLLLFFFGLLFIVLFSPFPSCFVRHFFCSGGRSSVCACASFFFCLYASFVCFFFLY